MTKDEKQTLKEYARIKQEQKEIKDKVSELKPEVEAIMEKNDNAPIESEFGKFTVVEQTRFEYPPHVKTLEEEVDEVKEHCEATGDVEEKTISYVKFSPAN